MNFLGLFNLNIFKGTRGFSQTHEMGFLSALLFGLIFAVGWTPCVGAFLGSALMLASQQGHVTEGMLMLLARVSSSCCVILPALASLFWPVPCSSNP